MCYFQKLDGTKKETMTVTTLLGAGYGSGDRLSGLVPNNLTQPLVAFHHRHDSFRGRARPRSTRNRAQYPPPLSILRITRRKVIFDRLCYIQEII